MGTLGGTAPRHGNRGSLENTLIVPESGGTHSRIPFQTWQNPPGVGCRVQINKVFGGFFSQEVLEPKHISVPPFFALFVFEAIFFFLVFQPQLS